MSLKMKWFFFILVLVPFVLADNSEDSLVSDSAKADCEIASLLEILSSLVTFVSECFSNLSIAELISVVDEGFDSIFPPPSVPSVPNDTWWGDQDAQEVDEEIRPYRIQFKPERTEKLLFLLEHRENFTRPLNNANFTYGINTSYLEIVLDHWQNEYDFDARENRLNQYPQYMTNVQGLDIHYYHIKPKLACKVVLPLLMLHGWPISNTEYIYMFPQLANPRKEYDFMFEIIAPSIPGFGYSQGTSKIGLSPYQIAVIFKNLMLRLGYQKFYIHAGDVGEVIASHMSTIYQNDILGWHTNFPYSFRPKTLVKYALGGLDPTAVVDSQYAERLYPLFGEIYFILRDFGYFHIHATKPDTLGVGLLESPAGLASWILTIMSWTSNRDYVYEPDGGLPQTFDIDDLLDILTVMWDSKAITTSARLYAEMTAFIQDPNILDIMISPTQVPYSCTKFRYEIFYQPDSFLEDKYPNLVYSNTLDFGGHFAAHEHPDVLTDNIWASVEKMMDFNRKRG